MSPNFKCIDYVYQANKLAWNRVRNVVFVRSRQGNRIAIAIPISTFDSRLVEREQCDSDTISTVFQAKRYKSGFGKLNSV